MRLLSFSSSVSFQNSCIYSLSSSSRRLLSQKIPQNLNLSSGISVRAMAGAVDKKEDHRISKIASSIRVIPNFPKPGVMFQDITTLLLEPKAFRDTIDLFVERYRDKGITVVAGVEARGFIFGPPIALDIGAKFVPMRKPRKLPGEVISEEYSLEYGTDKIEMHVGAVLPGEKVLVIDDLIATGGTLCAAIKLLERVGAEVVECACLIELPELKATRIYCFVHKVPVCGECICLPEHQICVVKNYSDWVVNGDYDWPPTCPLCNAALEAGTDTTRLGCLHVMHTSCLVRHFQSFPPQTVPAGYVCPACTSPIWPPKSIKDTGSRLHSKLKEAIIQGGLEKNLFGNHLVSLPTAESRAPPPPAFASDPLAHIPGDEDREKSGSNSVDLIRDPSLSSSSIAVGPSKHSESEIVEIDGPGSLGNQFVSDQDPKFVKSENLAGPGATTRKGPHHVDRQNSEMSYYADEEDASKKYTKRGSFRHKFFRFLLPLWSSALPTLPVTAPPRKDDVLEGRSRHQRSSRMDPRKFLLTMAIMACLATMGILYYRLAQGLGGDIPEDEPQ